MKIRRLSGHFNELTTLEPPSSAYMVLSFLLDHHTMRRYTIPAAAATANMSRTTARSRYSMNILASKFAATQAPLRDKGKDHLKAEHPCCAFSHTGGN